jgi:hypothetical protein
MSGQDQESKEPPSEWLIALTFDASHRAPPSAKARVWGRVQTAANPAAGGLAPQHAPAGKIAWLTARSTRVAVTTFVLGAATGAGLHAWLRHPAPARVVNVDRSAAPNPAPGDVPPVTSAPRHEALAAPRTTSDAGVERRLADRISDRGSERGSDLAAERALLDRAQRALRAGDRRQARRALDAHARRFPTGDLVEERQALSIMLLVAAGRTADAQKKAARFRARFPDSLFNPDFDDPDTIP